MELSIVNKFDGITFILLPGLWRDSTTFYFWRDST